MADFTGIRPQALLRTDFSTADNYVYPKPPHVSGFKKFLRGVGKVFSGLSGPLAAGLSFIPGIGLPLAAGVAGMGQLSSSAVQKSYAKDSYKMQEQQAELSGKQISMPGYFDQPQNDLAQKTLNFIAPESLQPGIGAMILSRDNAKGEALQKF